jgi:citrate synthase
MKAQANGLEGVIAAHTALSDVQGEAGQLVIAGASVEALGSFEETVARLWRAAGLSVDELPRRLGAARVAMAAQLDPRALASENGMEALRACVAQLSETDELDTAIRLVAASSVATAAWYCRQRGATMSAPDPGASHAADLLRLMLGDSDARRAAALDRYLVTVIDHGMNASTFTARVVASTGSDAVSAVVAAIGALKGPLHGGAPGPVLDMLDAIAAPQNAVSWIEQELAAGRRIMGMGHRIYRTRDPRAAVLERAIVELGGDERRLRLAKAVESAARGVLREKYPDRGLDTNVEFYTAVLLDAIGIDRRAFSPIFACGRTAGWVAHVAEQRRTGKLIRPQSVYVGRSVE